MTYKEFAKQSAYVLALPGRTWKTWASVLCVRNAFMRNVANGMIESEACYHALVNDSDDE